MIEWIVIIQHNMHYNMISGTRMDYNRMSFYNGYVIIINNQMKTIECDEH